MALVILLLSFQPYPTATLNVRTDGSLTATYREGGRVAVVPVTDAAPWAPVVDGSEAVWLGPKPFYLKGN